MVRTLTMSSTLRYLKLKLFRCASIIAGKGRSEDSRTIHPRSAKGYCKVCNQRNAYGAFDVNFHVTL